MRKRGWSRKRKRDTDERVEGNRNGDGVRWQKY